MGYNSKKPTGLMVGRFQPFHDGHLALFEEILALEGQVLILVRDTQGTSDKDPFYYDFVKRSIDAKLKQYIGRYVVQSSPNITGVYYGRDVGYKVQQIHLPDEIQQISGTKIRADMAKES